jgi:phage antirepressor YoqD-like protein
MKNSNIINSIFGRSTNKEANAVVSDTATNNVPAVHNGELTMSSLELVKMINEIRASETPGSAEIQHKDFLAKVEKVLGSHSENFRSDYIAGTGKAYKCYNLPKREACLMVMSESYRVQAAVYDRMEVLAAAPAPKPVYTLEDFAVALLESKAQNRVLTEKLETAQPSVEFVDTYVNSDGMMNTSQVATKFGMSAIRLNKMLKEMGYKQKSVSGKDVLTIKGVNTGWFVVKSWGRNGVVGEQIYITPAGVLALSQIVAE